MTRLDVSPERVLRKALDAGLQGVVVIGHDAEGHEYFASSFADGGNVLRPMERAKLALLQAGDRQG